MANKNIRTRGLTAIQKTSTVTGLALLYFGLAYQATSLAASTDTPNTVETSQLPPPPGPVQTISNEVVAPSSPQVTTVAATQIEQTPALATQPNILELAPNSPEAKLQTYLNQHLVETPVNIEGISFKPKTTQLSKESEAKLLLLAALLIQYPEARFLITTYTNETSTNQDSDQLSLMRANALGLQFVNAGIDGKRITIMGMGKRPSPDKNLTKAQAKQSQRLEISVID